MVHVLAPLKEDAEARHAEAQFSLGEMYAEGLSVQQDETQARSWFEHASQGHAEAQCRLGGMLAEGLGGSRDCTRIQHGLMKAAAQGNAGALFGLGMMLDEGLCVPQDRRATKARLGRACRSGARKACARARELDEAGQEPAGKPSGAVPLRGDGGRRRPCLPLAMVFASACRSARFSPDGQLASRCKEVAVHEQGTCRA